MLRNAAVDRVEGGRDDVDAKHHPGPAAVRLVVDLACAERRRVAVVEDAQLELRSQDCRQGTTLVQPVEGARDEREDVEAHSGEG